MRYAQCALLFSSNKIMLIHLICAARPNFMKIAPLYHALKKEDWANPFIVHTGQHYDLNMSDAFFKDLDLPEPDIHLGIGSGSHAEQTGKVMIAYEKVLMEKRPDLVIVVGDVNSTVACTLAASKIQYQLSAFSFELGQRPIVAHLEAGLRSFDRTMPEEINRQVTDVLADILWTHCADADENLIKEGISPDKIQRVGNIMIDSLEMLRAKIEEQDVHKEFQLERQGYGLVTLHRPSNVDDPLVLKKLCEELAKISQKIPLIFPIHPRTMKNLEQNSLYSLLKKAQGLFLPNPMSYIRFMNLVFNCRFIITDSGGIQEETTYLGIPCLTLRPNTERPITVTHGTNQLCELNELKSKVDSILSGNVHKGNKIELWDGKTAGRIVEFLRTLNGKRDNLTRDT
jgi:UDP-N-acetylglucosamine 2-epimerase (non-hydrolysing)